MPLLCLCFMAAFLDRVNVSFAKLTMLPDLGLSQTAYATGAGIFFVGYFLFEVPSNLLLQRFGARMWIARIMIVWGVVASRDDVRVRRLVASTRCVSRSARPRPASSRASSSTSRTGIRRPTARGPCRCS